MSPQHPYTLHSVNQITADKAHLSCRSISITDQFKAATFLGKEQKLPIYK